MEQLFSRIDANGDGTLSKADFEAGSNLKIAEGADLEQLWKSMQAFFDGSADGNIDRQEFASGFVIESW
jgi:Ca2+-binding EF-hand superfamily protein